MLRMPRVPYRLVHGRTASVILALALAGWTAALQAGEASNSFRVTINVLPEREGTCTASTSSGAPQVTCRPTLGGVVSGAQRGSDASMLLAYHRREPALRLAGEMIEIGTENHHAWDDGQPPDLATPRYSTEVVSAGGREYVQYTLAW